MASYYTAAGTFLYSDDPGVVDEETGRTFIDPATGQLRPQYASMSAQVGHVAGTPSGASPGAGVGGAPLSMGSTGTPPFALAPNTPPEQAIQQLLSLIDPQLRTRGAGFLAGINALQEQASGSPMALLRAGGPQLAQLGQQYRQGSQGLSRRLGPAGGGFLTSGQRQLGTQFGSQLAQLFAGIPGQAQGILGKLGEGTSIAFPVQQTREASGTSTQPGGYSVPGAQDIQGIMSALQGIMRLFSTSSAGVGASTLPFDFSSPFVSVPFA